MMNTEWEEDRTTFRTVGELVEVLKRLSPDLPLFSTWETICPPIWAVELSIDRTGRGIAYLHCDQDPPTESEALDVLRRGGVIMRSEGKS